jgi:hypothetical protein
MLAIGPVGSAARVRRARAAAPVVSVAAKRRREIVLGFMAGERGEGRSERSLKHLRPRIARPVETILTAHHCPVVRAKRLPVPPVVAA